MGAARSTSPTSGFVTSALSAEVLDPVSAASIVSRS